MADKEKITQKKAAFYILWKSHLENPEEYVPAWKFVGELHIKELGVWFLMSYKTPTNGLDIFFENNGLVERVRHKGKSGSSYYIYRISLTASLDNIQDPALQSFYKKVFGNVPPPERVYRYMVRTEENTVKIYNVKESRLQEFHAKYPDATLA